MTVCRGLSLGVVAQQARRQARVRQARSHRVDPDVRRPFGSQGPHESFHGPFGSRDARVKGHARLHRHGAEQHHPRLGSIRGTCLQQGVVGLQCVDGAQHVDAKVFLELFGLQAAQRLQLDGARAIHQAIQFVGKPRQVAWMLHGIKHQALVIRVLTAVALHATSRHPDHPHALVQQLLPQCCPNATAIPHNGHRPHDFSD